VSEALSYMSLRPSATCRSPSSSPCLGHLESGLRHLESGLRHLGSGLRHLGSGLRHLGVPHLGPHTLVALRSSSCLQAV
jgi:hypothetical protein